ncbi:uncharacterized protein BDZ99DRAFT_199527 [Mytilinidion resinicola]|uniref:Amidase domain-containing protein n=1 Tax=Mytilinidion resinicola TaxID=574789 RepID=A0A6A6Y4P8_9PEZI|nr:uncharacterized protein BDZ99DRAFT_199527 [Mytilinidion resinicola]KAF2802767.1 hypothetical protein BDZ99DRAFT_199527 [Mytilinidion resinicola]
MDISPQEEAAQGPSVAVAGYIWVDFGLGTDTGASIRGPESVMGLFALRPSITASDMTHIISISKFLDTTGVVCRTANVFHAISKGLYGQTVYIFPPSAH